MLDAEVSVLPQTLLMVGEHISELMIVCIPALCEAAYEVEPRMKDSHLHDRLFYVKPDWLSSG